MKTQLTPISELNPGDKIFVPWPEGKERPEWFKLPEVITVRKVNITAGTVDIEETGGLNLKETQFNRVIDIPEPEAGDKITFLMDWYNDLGLREDKIFTTEVNHISRDPMKVHKPKCIVTIEGEDYGITFDMISKIEKPAIQKEAQLQLF